MEKRAYSIASAPGSAQLELAVTLVSDGLLSPVLHRAELGTEVMVDGPHGFFTRLGPRADEPTLMVATGTGLAPFRSMLFDVRSRRTSSPADHVALWLPH